MAGDFIDRPGDAITDLAAEMEWSRNWAAAHKTDKSDFPRLTLTDKLFNTVLSRIEEIRRPRLRRLANFAVEVAALGSAFFIRTPNSMHDIPADQQMGQQ